MVYFHSVGFLLLGSLWKNHTARFNKVAQTRVWRSLLNSAKLVGKLVGPRARWRLLF